MSNDWTEAELAAAWNEGKPKINPWEEIPVTVAVTIPRWMIEFGRIEYGDPEMTAQDLVLLWVENMETNTYDIARDEGRLPVPPLEFKIPTPKEWGSEHTVSHPLPNFWTMWNKAHDHE